MTSLSTHPDLKTRLMVGMEIHVELSTRSKMWTSAPNVAHPDHFEAAPNTLLDPVVLGMPGTLPVMNKQALEMSILVGLALGCQIARHSKWDRKSYYYPDLPKNYQLSQYDEPICGQGELTFPVGDGPDAPKKTVRITRAHLEEDAGKLLHEAPGGGAIDYSIVDLNRAGTPLLEIVTEPDFATADEAVMFGRTLRNICRFLGVSEGIMQQGHMRFEPNINVEIEHEDKTYKTPIVEIKNLNSFKAVHGAIQYEHRRQVQEWLDTGRVMGRGEKATRGWDDNKQVTILQREKEDAHDYRYFPDPDLVPVVIDEPWLARIREHLPELPLQREQRYVRELGLKAVDARTLVSERDVCQLFEATLAAGVEGRRAAALLLNYGAKLANERGCLISDLGVTATQLKAIDALSGAEKISSNGAASLFALCCDHPGEDADKLAEAHGLLQVSDEGALDDWVAQAIDAEPKAADDVRNGKRAAMGRLVGAGVKLRSSDIEADARSCERRDALRCASRRNYVSLGRWVPRSLGPSVPSSKLRLLLPVDFR